MSRLRVLVAAAAVSLVAGCSAGPAAEPAPGPAPAPAPAATTTRAAATGAEPVAEPARLAIGDVEIGRPVTASVLVRPARVPVRFAATELRGGVAYELTGDGCSGRRLAPTDEGCRLEVTVLARGTGEYAARLVLPHDRGKLTVPVVATVPLSYTVVVTVLGNGTVSGDLAGISCSGRCSSRVAQGATLTLTAPQDVTWSGACTSRGTRCRARVDTPLEITADFR